MLYIFIKVYLFLINFVDDTIIIIF